MNGKTTGLTANSSPADQAALWMSRRMSGTMTAEERQALDAWLQTEENRTAFEQLDANIASLDVHAADLLEEAFEDELWSLDQQRRERRWALPAAAGLAATVAVATAVSLLYPWQSPPAPALYRTAVGETETIVLDDGSRIILNTATAATMLYTDEERRVDLTKGEAFFDVARDPNRPFRVWTDEGMLEVTGTSFNVKALGELTEIAVVSGAVDVRAEGGGAITVIAGEVTSFVEDQERLIASSFDATRVLSWRQGRLIFDDTPLVEAISELNRYTHQRIVLAPGVHEDTPISGSFETANIADLATAIGLALGLETDFEAGRIVIRPASE